MRHAGTVAFSLALAAVLAPARGFADRDEGRGRPRFPPGQTPITVTGFQPQSGPPGTLVTITGSGFIQQTTVFFNGRRVRQESRDWTRLRFAIPPDATSGAIVLRQPGARNDVMVGQFTVFAPAPFPPPLISGFAPPSGPPGTRVALYGSFAPGDQVSFNGQPLPVADFAADRLSVTVPPGARDDVFMVVRPSTREAAHSAERFHVGGAAPFVSGIMPASGPPGIQVRVSGEGFGPDDVVTYGRDPVSIVSRSSSHFDVIIPRNASHNRPLVVRGPRGEASSQEFVLVLDQPSILGFEPRSGPPGTRVALSGRAFRPGDSVLFSGRELAIDELGPERIVVAIPGGVATDVFTLRRGGQVVATSSASFVVLEQAPSIAGFVPQGGPPGTSVTLRGDGFTLDARVSYGAQALPIVGRQGDRSLTVVVPRNATRSEPFVVQTRAGQTRSGAWFQLTLPAVIDSLTPTSGPPGTAVTIRGRGLHGDEVFYLGPGGPGDVALETVERRGDTVVVRMPPTAQSGVVAFDSLGERRTTPFRFEVVVVPIVHSFAPVAGPPGTQVEIHGQHLATVASVSYGTLPAAIVRRAPRELVVEIPPSAQGADYLWLDSPGGRVRSGEVFRVAPPPPALGGFSPPSGPVGTQVVLDGSFLPPDAQVSFSGLACPVVSRGPRRVVFTIPPGAVGRAPFVVTDGAGNRMPTAAAFEVLLPPPPPDTGLGHHAHAHEHPHGDGGHHHHPHVHPHPPGDTHHHPF